MGNLNKYLKVGWKEWGSLPDLDIDRIHIKMDTGAKNSTLHCVKHEKFERNGSTWVRFWTAADQEHNELQLCEAKLIDSNDISSEETESSERLIVQCQVNIGDQTWPINVALTDRSSVRYRMQLGREAMSSVAVFPHESHIQGKII